MELHYLTPTDNSAVATLIRYCLEDEGLALPGTAYFDPQLDDLASYYADLERADYFVLKDAGQVVACGGFGPISESVCELQKLYVDKNYRRKGYASQLLAYIEEKALQAGYEQMYLESSTKLAAALKLYEKMGYKQLAQPLTQETGHYLMDVWMVKSL
ncbi:GNAT family N-acetyltransferase [Streptococcus entericus]|uniref:GNAT family N-acetyltransferase n=1 Tax=Streptococcus entericus TaxID=155680 RepID=UPI00035CF910|nr:GNAT family N-acetyltransferase [Streptococcus entericus]